MDNESVWLTQMCYLPIISILISSVLLFGCSNAKTEQSGAVYPANREDTAFIQAEEGEAEESEKSALINLDSLKIYLSEARVSRQKLEEELKYATPEQADSIYWNSDFHYEQEQIDRLSQLVWPVVERWGLNGGEIAVMQDNKILNMLKKEGFEPEYMGEGYAELRVNAYHYYNIFSPYLSEKNREFLKLYAENDRIIEMDAGLVIPLDTLVVNCIRWESFLRKYPDIAQRKMIVSQYGLYMGLIMFCTYDNTRAFDLQTKTADKYVLETVSKAIRLYADYQTTKIFEYYLSELEKSGYKYSRRIENIIMSMGILKEFDRTDVYY
jgi:hypothetical protein